MVDRLRFGIFMAPFHPAGDNPTLAFERDVQLISKHVMPQLQGQAWSTLQGKARTEASRPELAAAPSKAVEDVTARYQAEVSGKGQ
jgi:limonene 1,2-monooxygenase